MGEKRDEMMDVWTDPLGGTVFSVTGCLFRYGGLVVKGDYPLLVAISISIVYE